MITQNSKLSPNWIDMNTMKTIQCTIANIYLERVDPYTLCQKFLTLSTRLSPTAVKYLFAAPSIFGKGAKIASSCKIFVQVIFNLPLRIPNCILAATHKNYYKIAFDVAAFASLLLFGGAAAIAVDCTAEIIHIYQKSKARQKEALETLGLSKAEAKTPTLLNQRYQELTRECQQQISQSSAPVEKEFEKILSEVHAAYKILS